MKNKYLLIFLGFIFILFIVAFTTYDPFQNFFDKNWLGLTQLAVALISIFTGLYVSNLQQASAKKTLELNQFKEKFKICEAVEDFNSKLETNHNGRYEKEDLRDFWKKIQPASKIFNNNIFIQLQKLLYIASHQDFVSSTLPSPIWDQLDKCVKNELNDKDLGEKETFNKQYLDVKDLLNLNVKKLTE
jgi:hypothetical protein